MIDWKDITSYSKGQRGKVEPSVLEAEIEDVAIRIHRHIHYPETWLLTCYDMNIEKEILYTNDFEKAERKAMKIIFNRLERYKKLSNKLLGLLS